MTTMTEELTSGTDDQSTVNHATPAGMTLQDNLAVPVQPRRGSGWRREPGVSYLVCLDVDGTLVNHDGQMSDRVHDAVTRVVEAGHHVVIATGRSKGATLPVINRVGVERGWAVCSNGGITLELGPDLPDHYRVADRVVFSPRPALEALRRILPAAKFALEAPDGTFYATERFQDSSFGGQTVAVSFQELLDMDAVRLVMYSPENTTEDFSEAIREAGLSGVTYSVGWSAWLDVAAQGVSKATALEAVRQRLGVDRAHTVAVGDGRNDIEMLTWADRGVAMGQAPDEVAEVAREVVGTVEEDGVAEALAPLF